MIRPFPARRRLGRLAAGLGLVAALALPAGPAAAQQVTAEEARTLADAIQDSIDRQITPDMREDVVLDGEVQVVPAEGRYEISLPAITVHGQDGARVAFGRATATARPIEGDDFFVTARIPERMGIFDDSGSRIGDVTIGAQDISGVFDQQLGLFTSWNGEIQDLVAEPRDKPDRLTLARMTVDSAVDEGRGGTISGTAEAVLRDLRFSGRAGGEPTRTRIERIEIASQMTDFDWDRYRELIPRMQDLSADLKAAGGAEIDPEMADLMSQILETFGAMGGEMRLIGIEGQNGGESMRLDRAILGFDAGGFAGDSGQFALRLGHDGLQPGGEVAASPFVPQRSNLTLGLENLPMRAILEEMGRMAGQAGGELGTAMGPQLAQSLRDILARAGTEIVIRDTAFRAQSMGGDLDGALAFDVQAEHGLVGAMELKLAGLRQLSERFAREGSGGGQIMGILSMLQALGQMRETENGQSVHVFNVEVKRDGRMLLNGADLSSVMQMMGQQPGGSATP